MKITRDSVRGGSLGPPLLDYLRQIPDGLLFFRQHQIRHPLGIYNLSLQQLAVDFAAVLDEYFAVTRRCELVLDGKFSEPTELLTRHKALLYTMRSHLDDCCLVLKAFVDSSVSPSCSVFTETYVAESKLPGFKTFQQALAGYLQGYLAPVTNKLKHQQGMMRAIVLYGDGFARVGYFVEEPDKDGVMAPSHDVHKGGNSAFSFARDILFNLFQLYYCSERIAKVVLQVLSAKGHHLQPTPEPAGEPWTRLIKAAAQVNSSLVFPDEPKRGLPSLRFTPGTSPELVLKYPDKGILLRSQKRLKFTVFTKGDGISRSFKMPYWKSP